MSSSQLICRACNNKPSKQWSEEIEINSFFGGIFFGSEHQGFLQWGVLHPRGSYKKGFLQLRVLQQEVLTTRSLITRGSYNQGSLQRGVLTNRSLKTRSSYKQATRGLTTKGSYLDQPSFLTNRRLKTRGSYNKGSLQPTSSFTTSGLQPRVLKFKSSYIKGF